MLTILLMILPFEIAALYYTIRRSGFLPFPHVLLVYMIGCEISIYLVASGLAEYSFLVTYSTHAFSTHYWASQALFSGIFAVSFILFLPPKSVRFFAFLERWLRETGNVALNANVVRFVIAFLWVYHILLFLSLDWAAVWRNNTYLLMSGERILAIANPLTRFFVAALPFSSLLVFVMLGYYGWRRGRSMVILLLPLATFDLMYQLGAHSRKAVLYIMVCTGLSYLLRKNRAVLVLGGMAAAVGLAFALGGRGYGVHGISTLLSPIEVLSRFFAKSRSFAFFNLFEGAFSVTELFNRTYENPLWYKILSFSPLPSFIDGFNGIRDAGMHKLGKYSPPSAIFEVWSFGPLYVILFVATQIVAGRMVIALLAKDRGLLAVAANAVLAFACFVQFTYPVRTVYRFFLLAIVLAAVGRSRRRPRVIRFPGPLRAGEQGKTVSPGPPRGRVQKSVNQPVRLSRAFVLNGRR